jgi:prepilin-type N-terminal cleavage/methylation domain-containing protein
MRKFQSGERGFSLIELMTVVAILTLVMGVVFQQIITVQHRYRTEEAKLDITQESREFLDQMVRDLHQAGYPTANLYDSITVSPKTNDHRVAAGLVKFAYNDLWFEGDVDGDGQVDVVEYKLNAPGGTCPCTIQRRQTLKNGDASPLSFIGSSFQTELQSVVNSGGAYTISGTGPGGVSNQTLYGALASQNIFLAYDASGTLVSPTDIGANPTLLASIRTIKITINVLAAQKASDLQTGRRAPISLTAIARLSN